LLDRVRAPRLTGILLKKHVFIDNFRFAIEIEMDCFLVCADTGVQLFKREKVLNLGLFKATKHVWCNGLLYVLGPHGLAVLVDEKLKVLSSTNCKTGTMCKESVKI
jgi:hypothetical protein